MPKEVPREVIVRRQIGVNICGSCGETIEDVFPPGKYPLIEGLAVREDGSQTQIFLIATDSYDSWLPAWEWLLKASQGKVELVF